jgi:hypothetical protein
VLAVRTEVQVQQAVLAAGLGLTTQVQILQAALPHQVKVMLAVLQQIAPITTNRAAAVALVLLVVTALLRPPERVATVLRHQLQGLQLHELVVAGVETFMALVALVAQVAVALGALRVLQGLQILVAVVAVQVMEVIPLARVVLVWLSSQCQQPTTAA